MLYLLGIAWLGVGGCFCFVFKWVCAPRTCLVIHDMGIMLETYYVLLLGQFRSATLR